MMRVLVLPAACMHGAFIAGVLAGFEQIGIAASYFKAIVGASAGGWNGVYYLTGDLQTKGWRLWCVLVPNGFLRWRWCRPYADIAYLDHITCHEEPFSRRGLRKSKTNLFVTVTDFEARSALYVHLNVQRNPGRYLVAGSAMALLSAPQEIEGKLYGDGGLTDTVPLRFAEDLGADEVWVVLTMPPGYRESEILWRGVSCLASSPTERALLAASAGTHNAVLSEIEQRSDLVVVRPAQPLPASRFTRNAEKMRLMYELGKKAGISQATRY